MRRGWVIICLITMMATTLVAAGCGAPPAPPAEAEFQISNLTITPTEVKPGEEIAITAEVKNIGEVSGIKTVTLKIDGVGVETKDITLGGGETRTVSFTVVQDNAGTYSIGVDGLSKTLLVKAPSPAAFQITNLMISPEETMVGKPVEISVTVTNTGDLEGTYTGKLMLDGAVEASQDIAVAGGSEKVLSFTITKNTAKIYNATIDTLTAPFVVMTNHLILTMSFDNDPNGYPQGAEANAYILEEHRFRLEDRYGTFNGDYSWKLAENELTLDFDTYPAWYMTLDPDGSFSGSEHGYANGGTYNWQ